LNWFIAGVREEQRRIVTRTSGELGTTRWPFASKYFRKDARISFAVIVSIF